MKAWLRTSDSVVAVVLARSLGQFQEPLSLAAEQRAVDMDGAGAANFFINPSVSSDSNQKDLFSQGGSRPTNLRRSPNPPARSRVGGKKSGNRWFFLTGRRFDTGV